MIEIFCHLDNDSITLQFDQETLPEDIMKQCLSLKAAASPDKTFIPKLYHNDGSIIPIGPNIPKNSESSRYKLVYSEATSLSVLLKAEAKSTALKEIDVINKKITQLNNFSFTNNKKLIVKPAVSKVQKLVAKNSPFVSWDLNSYSDQVLQDVKSSTIDIWAYTEDDMSSFLVLFLQDMGITKHFNMSLDTLKNFITILRQSYNANPFHNFKHAFCVTQMLYSILNMTRLVDKLTMIEKLALMIGAMAHDLDHPGFNNAYQMNAMTELAIAYNDISPLENHHSAVLFAILKHPELNILSNLSLNDYKEFRKLAITCILATDMGKHAEMITRLRESIPTFSMDDNNHRVLLFQLLFKCADISNESRPTKVSEPWVDLLLQEFFHQSDEEKARGLPFAPFMDREKVTKASAQVGFIGFVLLPLIDEVSKLLPELKVIIPTIQAAKEYYLSTI